MQRADVQGGQPRYVNQDGRPVHFIQRGQIRPGIRQIRIINPHQQQQQHQQQQVQMQRPMMQGQPQHPQQPRQFIIRNANGQAFRPGQQIMIRHQRPQRPNIIQHYPPRPQHPQPQPSPQQNQNEIAYEVRMKINVQGHS